MGNWEWGAGNGELGMGDWEWGTGNGVGADTSKGLNMITTAHLITPPMTAVS